MEDKTFALIFTYNCFGGPYYKFFARWSYDDYTVCYHYECCYPDSTRMHSDDLNLNDCTEFHKKYDQLIANKEETIVDPNKEFDIIHDAPMCQLVISEGLYFCDVEEWQVGNEFFDVKPLYDMILICDKEATFLIEED